MWSTISREFDKVGIHLYDFCAIWQHWKMFFLWAAISWEFVKIFQNLTKLCFFLLWITVLLSAAPKRWSCKYRALRVWRRSYSCKYCALRFRRGQPSFSFLTWRCGSTQRAQRLCRAPRWRCWRDGWGGRQASRCRGRSPRSWCCSSTSEQWQQL